MDLCYSKPPSLVVECFLSYDIPLCRNFSGCPHWLFFDVNKIFENCELIFCGDFFFFSYFFPNKLLLFIIVGVSNNNIARFSYVFWIVLLVVLWVDFTYGFVGGFNGGVMHGNNVLLCNATMFTCSFNMIFWTIKMGNHYAFFFFTTFCII